MRNIGKVAKWEIKRNMKNKSFIIGLFITPVIFLLFMFIPKLFINSEKPSTIHLYINDEINIIDQFQTALQENNITNWELHQTDVDENMAHEKLLKNKNTAFIHLNEIIINEGVVPLYVSKEMDTMFSHQLVFLEEPLRLYQLKVHGFTENQLQIVNQGITFNEIPTETKDIAKETFVQDPIKRLVPGALAGIILFSILISGMMIFQSASQEKKDKIAEIILSSITPNELMQGKIIGYFVLGLIQVFIWIGIALPVFAWQSNFPIFEYIFVPELIILLLIAILGYLLFAALFVGIGATIEDVSTSGKFQGMVLMLPFLPIVFTGPIFSDPNGLVAKIATFVPFTSPATLIVRLSLLEEWPWGELAIALVVLVISVWLFMKLAGKIFKIGILLYGKNATPKEIWKWLWV